MHFPYTIDIFGQPVLFHGLAEFMGIFIAFRYYICLRKKQGDHVDKEQRLYVIAGAILGAVIGARIIGALENVPQWMAAPNKWVYFYGNKTLVGGLLGGLAGVELMKKIIGERQNTGDLFTFPLILGMIIGRAGCFSAGVFEETYGVPTHLPWAMDLGDGILRHPVTLYEILFLVVLWIVLARIRIKYPLKQGSMFKLMMIAYLVFRFSIDFIKPGWRYCMGLGTIQLACLAGLVYYSRYIIKPGLMLEKE